MKVENGTLYILDIMYFDFLVGTVLSLVLISVCVLIIVETFLVVRDLVKDSY